VTQERKVRVAVLPELRLAYFERRGTLESVQAAWDELNAWRADVRPALGRIDIAAIGWYLSETEGDTEVAILRAGVPVRSDYRVEPPARVMLFPGREFVYAPASDGDEYGAAFAAAADYIERERLAGEDDTLEAAEVHLYHFNLDQHPAECGYLLPGEVRPQGGHASPLPIAPR